MMLFKEKQNKEYTIIVGCGRLGASLANEVSDRNGNVLIMDKDATAFRKLSPSFGGLTQVGNGLDLAALYEAHIEKAQVFIVVTDDDNTNVMLAQIAKDLYHIHKVIVRLNDPERQEAFNGKDIKTICPSLLSSREIGAILAAEVPPALITPVVAAE